MVEDSGQVDEPMIGAAARKIAEGIAAAAPEGWTEAVLAVSSGPGGLSYSGDHVVSGAVGRRIPVQAPFGELHLLAEGVRRVRGWQRMTLELRCRPSGEHELTAVDDSLSSLRSSGDGFLAVLDDDYLLPVPGTEQEPGTAAPAGDPALAAANLRTCLERRAAILGRPDRLPPAASDAGIEAVERSLGHALPADLRALYRIADGDEVDGRSGHLVGGYGWLPLKSMAAVHERLSVPAWFGWGLGWNAVVLDADPAETVRRCGGHPAWLPFAGGGDGNFLAVDLAPARDGRPGQVIRIGRDHDEGPQYVAESVTALFGRYADQLAAGAYEVEEDWIGLTGGAFGEEATGADRASVRREIIGAIPDTVPPHLQALHLNDAAGPVDLAPLTAAPRLRRLHLNRSVTADLTPLRELPVESLRVTLAGGDLTPLAGHRALRALELATPAEGGAVPVDLAVLRTVPNLRALDLSGAAVRDLTVLADLPELRYLALSGRQWAELSAAGRVPVGLAAVRLADREAPMAEALAWAAGLGLDTGGALRLRLG
ncbi:SMI1/KNR4 family protein [Kitasatospora sp. NPDC004799]|uniref:SMI1/KNR4 family protein n=1 Tax=Kitasatospora sp. NPDC004799 TaxID=3154460 RepID=UPI0033AA99A9